VHIREQPGHSIADLAAHTLAARLVTFASGATAAVLIARALGPDGRGLYYLPITMAIIASAIASLGVEQAQFRLWDRSLREDFATTAVLLGAGLGLAALGLTWVVYAVGHGGAFAELSPGQLAMVSTLLPLWVHLILMRSLLIMGGELPRANLAYVIGDLTRTAGLIVLWLTVGLTVDRVLGLFACTVVVPWLVIVTSPWRPLRLRLPVPWHLLREQLRLGAVFAPYFLFLFLTLRVDVLFVAGLSGAEAVGLYSIAVLFAELVWLATEALRLAVRERQANAPRQEAIEVSASCIRMSVLVSVLMGGALAAIAPVGISLVFGSSFSPAVDAVWVLLPAAGAMAAWRVAGVALNRFERPWFSPAVGLAAISANVALNVILIPSLGISGAALASLISYGLGAVLAGLLLVRAGGLSPRRLLPGRDEVTRLAHALRSPPLRRLGRVGHW
jgi:O-antigen/teichoic acid export membrane protein